MANTEIQSLITGSRVYTTATVGRGAAVHFHGAEVVERRGGSKALALRGHAMCAQPGVRSGATRVVGPVTCKRCLSYDNLPTVV